MATEKQAIRNIIKEIDDQIRKANNFITLYGLEKGSSLINDMSKEEKEIRKDETENLKEQLIKLKEYCIYKA
jgi:hypothetical protein